MRSLLPLFTAILALAACETPTEAPTALPSPSLTKMASADITLTDDRFRASVFYDGIQAPDGILPLTDSRLLVVKEYGSEIGVFLAKKGRAYAPADAFSTLGPPFVNPDDIAETADHTVYVADGQAQAVFRIDKLGGTPEPFVTTETTRPSFNPFGLAIAPAGYSGPNVDPGDILVADNAAGGGPGEWAVWAVNPVTGAARTIAEGAAFTDGPITLAFASDGTLFVVLNTFTGALSIVTLAADGTVTPFFLGTGQRSELAINPITDELFFVMADGDIWRMPFAGGMPTLFASGLGGTQDITFNDAGTSLLVSSRVRRQVVEIHAVRSAWK